MKKILFTLLFLIAFFTGYSQLNNSGGTITVESGATLVIEGNYTSTNNGVLVINGNVQLKGNFINTLGTISPTSTTGTLTFNGAAPQQIGGATPTNFYCSVVVNNGGNGVSLTGADEVLMNALTLTNGKLTLNAYDLTMAAVGITATSSSYVVTNNSLGELKSVVAGSNVTFPVGTATAYNPITLNNTGGTSDTYGVVYTGAMPGGWTGTNHAVTGNWKVSEALGTGSNLAVTTQWNTADQQSAFDNTDCSVGLSGDNGATVAWTTSGPAAGTNPYTRTGSGFTTVGTFLVGDYFYEGIDLDLDVFLAGPYSGGVMSTALKTNGLIPLNDPYSNGLNATSIPANAVDWVEVELRAPQNTPVKSYSFFVDNNGNVMNLNGNIGTKLTGIAKGSYYVAIRHRNHLGAMTASPIDFTAAGPFAFNYSLGTGIYGTNAMRNIGGVYALWAGDANGDGQIVYQGANNDPTPVGNAVSSAPGNTGNSFTYIVNGYLNTDINLDGQVIYQGANNDPTPIGNSVSGHPGNSGNSFTYAIIQQLP